MNVNELIDAAMQATEIESDRELSRRIGVSHTIVGQWRSGDRFPTFEAAATLAAMAGLPITATAAAIRLQAPDGHKHRSVLKQIATAAAICLAVYTAIPSTANAAPAHLTISDRLDIAHFSDVWHGCSANERSDGIQSSSAAV